MLKTLCLKGKVFSGTGEGARFVNLPWARKQIEKKMGFSPYPGTLNIELTNKSINVRKALTEATSEEISPVPGYCPARLFKASLRNLDCAIVIPEVYGYREDVVELIASANLRQKLHLLDDCPVEVEVTF